MVSKPAATALRAAVRPGARPSPCTLPSSVAAASASPVRPVRRSARPAARSCRRLSGLLRSAVPCPASRFARTTCGRHGRAGSPIAVPCRFMKAISGLKLSTCASFQMPRSCSLISPTLLDAGRLDKDEAETAERVAAEMHDVKGAAGAAGIGAIMHHRRHHEAVFQRQAADRTAAETASAMASGCRWSNRPSCPHLPVIYCCSLWRRIGQPESGLEMPCAMASMRNGEWTSGRRRMRGCWHLEMRDL